MQIYQYSATGSIRENNQDRLKAFSDLRLAILADGFGPSGAEAADYAVAALAESLKEAAHSTYPERSQETLLKHILAASSAASQRFASSGCDMAALWINRSTIAAVATGKCSILHMEQQQTLETTGLSLPNNKDLKFILCSEGAAIQATDGRVTQKIESALQAASHESLSNLGELMEAIYDGDDCSMILVKTDAADQIYPREIELISHIDKEFSFPLWVPVSLAGGLGLAVTLLGKKALSLSNKILKN